jgi:Cytochrome c554 and c-prime
VRALILAALLLAAGCLCWILMRARPVPPEPPAVPRLVPPAGVPPLPEGLREAGLVVAWSGDTSARFEPCGCTAGMFGGLSRRAALLARVEPGRLLALELGGWCAGGEDYQLLRSAAYLAGLARAGIRAVGIGRAEVALGAPALRAHGRTAAGLALALVSANVLASDGAALVPPLALVHAGGMDLAITSVAPSDATGPGLSVRDPADAVAGLLARAQGAPLIVLADLDEAALQDFARAVPGVALVIGGAVSSPSPRPLTVGAARVVHVANHGKVAGWWAWGSDSCQFELIADTLPPQDEMVRIAADYQHRLAQQDLALDRELALPAGAPAYAGSAACTGCHAQAAASHASSRHAAALRALVAKGQEQDPDCLRCHVTGLERPTGFRRGHPGPGLDAVGCEACHGPGSLHVAAAGAGEPNAARLLPVTPALCATCHDGENSPRFSYLEWWARIAHGR